MRIRIKNYPASAQTLPAVFFDYNQVQLITEVCSQTTGIGSPCYLGRKEGVHTQFKFRTPVWPVANTSNVRIVFGNMDISNCDKCSFTFNSPPIPVVQYVDPVMVPTVGSRKERSITVTAFNLGPQTRGALLRIKVGNSFTESPVLKAVSSTTVTAKAVVPSGLSVGTKTLSIYWSDRPHGVATFGTFSQFNPTRPRVLSIDPNQGYSSGGMQVKVLVANLLDRSSSHLPNEITVRVCNTNSSCTSVTPNQMVMQPPKNGKDVTEITVAMPVSTVGIVLATVSLAAAPSLNGIFRFTYVSEPQGNPSCHAIPAIGAAHKQTRVTVTLTNFYAVNDISELSVLFATSSGVTGSWKILDMLASVESTTLNLLSPPIYDSSKMNIPIMVNVFAISRPAALATFAFTFKGKHAEILSCSPHSAFVTGGARISLQVKNLGAAHLVKAYFGNASTTATVAATITSKLLKRNRLLLEIVTPRYHTAGLVTLTLTSYLKGVKMTATQAFTFLALPTVAVTKYKVWPHSMRFSTVHGGTASVYMGGSQFQQVRT